MATVQFLGNGDSTDAFNIDHVLLNRALLPGEYRLRTAFPYPALENWRRVGLQSAAVTPVTGNSDLGTRARTVVLFAHEAELSSVFFHLVHTDAGMLTGFYVDKVPSQRVAKAIAVALQNLPMAILELKQQMIPDQYINLLVTRMQSAAFVHRVAGFCAAIYLTSILLDQAQK